MDDDCIMKISQNYYHNKSFSSHDIFSLGLDLHCSGDSDNADSDVCDISDICVYPHHLDRRSSFIISSFVKHWYTS